MRTDAQSWSAQAGTGYGFDNCISPYGTHDGADMGSPMWGAGLARSFGDSSTHFRVGLEWEHEAWRESFVAYSGGSLLEERQGKISRNLDLLRMVPQVIVPLSHLLNIVAGLDLGIVVHARTMETAQHRYSWSDWSGAYPYGSWSPSDSAYTGTTGLNSYQWSVRVGCEVRVRKQGFLALSIAAGNTTFREPDGMPDRQTPVFGRFSVGCRF